MVFWFHYNKPASKKAGHPKMSVHFKKTCHIVDGVIVSVPTWSSNRKTQPRLVIKGQAKKIQIENNIARII